jgi:hypothetical protein
LSALSGRLADQMSDAIDKGDSIVRLFGIRDIGWCSRGFGLTGFGGWGDHGFWWGDGGRVVKTAMIGIGLRRLGVPSEAFTHSSSPRRCEH